MQRFGEAFTSSGRLFPLSYCRVPILSHEALTRDDVRCRLKEQNPGKGPDHEVSSVQWIHSWEFDNFMQCPGCRHAICLLLPHALACSVFAPRQHMWRFQDDQAHLYGQWLRNDAGNNNQRVEEQGQHQKPDHDSNDQSSGEHRRLIMV